MSDVSMSMNVRVRLSAMMFLQFMMFAVWWVPLAAFLGGQLGVTGTQRGLIMSTMAFGCLIAPIIGMIADRHFASQKVLAVLNLLGAVLLFVAAQQTNPTAMFVVLLLQMLCYMPTWGLTSSIAMANSSSEAFPHIRVFGSIGWVASGVFGFVALQLFNKAIDGTAIPFYCGAGISLISVVLALTLPNTPPPAKGQKASVIDVLGLRSIVLLKDFNFAAFIVITTLVMIPFSIYFNYCSLFLSDKGFKLITVTMNWGQFVEMFIMVMVPLAMARLGVKWAMAAGLAALVVRYMFFYFGGTMDQAWMFYGGILIHGIIFALFFVGGQVYVDKKAPTDMRAQAQGLLFLISFGIGFIAGNLFNEFLIGKYSTTQVEITQSCQLSTEATFDPAQLTIAGVTLSDVKLYNRILNGTELEVLASSGDPKKIANLLAEAEKNEEISVDIDKGINYQGNLEGLSDKAVGAAFTFSAKLTLPADDKATEADDILNGSIISAGSGDNGLSFSIDKENYLVFKVGDKDITARTVSLAREEKKEKAMYIACTFDGKNSRLYTNGAAYKMYNWDPIWKITTIFSAVLLVLFVIIFHHKDEKKEEQKS